MIRVEIKDIKDDAGRVETEIKGKTVTILNEYRQLVKNLYSVLTQKDEKDAKELLKDITSNAIEECIEETETTEDKIKRKIKELKHDPVKTEKILKALFED